MDRCCCPVLRARPPPRKSGRIEACPSLLLRWATTSLRRELLYHSCVAGAAEDSQDRAYAGLCAGCVHARRIQSARRSFFYLCERSATDPRFPKYPRLPVVACPGHTPKSGESSDPLSS